MDKNTIQKTFHKRAIVLGISERKEGQILEKLVSMLKNNATVIEIPTQFGWFRKNEDWGYMFPGELIWEDVKKRV